MDYGILFIVVSQAYSEKTVSEYSILQPRIESLVGGEGIGMHADGVLLLSANEDEPETTVCVAKCRYGRKGITYLKLDAEHQQFLQRAHDEANYCSV